jgi:hypothetical protein
MDVRVEVAGVWARSPGREVPRSRVRAARSLKSILDAIRSPTLTLVHPQG